MSSAIAKRAKAYSESTRDFMQYPGFKEELTKLIPFAEEIYFLGGEPTLIDSHLQRLWLILPELGAFAHFNS